MFSVVSLIRKLLRITSNRICALPQRCSQSLFPSATHKLRARMLETCYIVAFMPLHRKTDWNVRYNDDTDSKTITYLATCDTQLFGYQLCLLPAMHHQVCRQAWCTATVKNDTVTTRQAAAALTVLQARSQVLSLFGGEIILGGKYFCSLLHSIFF